MPRLRFDGLPSIVRYKGIRLYNQIRFNVHQDVHVGIRTLTYRTVLVLRTDPSMQ